MMRLVKCSPKLPDVRLRFSSIAEQIMVMPAVHQQKGLWTLEEFYRERDTAPPGVRFEYVDGEVLVTPAPHWVHQRIVTRLFTLMEPYVRAHALGEIFPAAPDVLLDPRLVLQPDLLIVPPGELRKRSDIVRRLLLAAEVLSPGSAKHDRVTKRPLYQRNRVSEYWIIDDRSQTVERWRPDDERPAILAEVLEWHPEGASEPFVLDLQAFFAEVVPPDE